LRIILNQINQNKSVQLAILNQNISPEIKWDDKTGNRLVKKIT